MSALFLLFSFLHKYLVSYLLIIFVYHRFLDSRNFVSHLSVQILMASAETLSVLRVRVKFKLLSVLLQS